MQHKTLQNDDDGLRIETTFMNEGAGYLLVAIAGGIGAVFLGAAGSSSAVVFGLPVLPCALAAIWKMQRRIELFFNHERGRVLVPHNAAYKDLKLIQIRPATSTKAAVFRVEIPLVSRVLVVLRKFSIEGGPEQEQAFLSFFEAKKEEQLAKSEADKLHEETRLFRNRQLPEGGSAKEGSPVAVPLSFSSSIDPVVKVPRPKEEQENMPVAVEKKP